LHDDINQQLAALSIALSSLKRRLPEAARDLEAEVDRLQRQTVYLSDDIRSLSHELHPGILQHAGLAAALTGRCTEFALEHGIEVSVEAEKNLGDLPAEIALCLYRVAQEALHNTAAHARARRARVALRRTVSGLELAVSDDGCGFDVGEAKKAGGLGLLSIDERVRLVRGVVWIESRPQWGTEVRVRIPLGLDGNEKRERWGMAEAEEVEPDTPLRSVPSNG
jgi:two-component system sensor histidine kinase UhpB